MNFIREVVEIVNENKIVDSRKQITKIIDEINNYQFKIKTFIEENYVDFLPSLSYNQLYLEEGSRLINEAEHLSQTIKNETRTELLSATDELQIYTDELHEVILGLRTSFKILKIDQLFQHLNNASTNLEFLKIMSNISQIKTLIDDPEDLILKHLDCFENIKIKWHIEHEMLLHNLKQRFESLVQLNEKSFQKSKSVTLKITKDDVLLHDTIVALINSKYNPRPICDFLLDNVFEPIITKPVSIQCDEENPDFATLTLSFSITPLADDLRPNYQIVFKNIQLAIQCLSYMNISIAEHICVFGIFSDCIKERFLNLIRNNCLAYSIPNTMDEMNDSTMVDDIIEFNNFLCEMMFLKKSDDELPQFAEKVEILFKNRFCLNILDNAVDIMRKDLHDMMFVAETDLPAINVGSPAAFPRCMVSKSTAELINLMEKVIRQSSTATEDVAQRLLSTIPIILERYLTEVPNHHAKLLLNIPQQTALFHNNCMYLAYWLTKNQNKGIEMFATIVKSLHHCGSEHFLHQIVNQREQMMDILKEFDLSEATSELDATQHKVVRQCLRQLDLLKNVWQTILPDIVYNKTMGNILNDFCTEIIRRILIVEDIPSAVASGLVEICETIIERAPSIFQDPLQVSIIVKSWVKLTQLKMILNASMAKITEQWAEGKGPLTLNYRADEIKHLIRALFQNTDRRANALSSIV